MTSGFQKTVTLLTIPANTAVSNVISGSDIDVFDKLTIYAPIAFTGAVNVEISFSEQPVSGTWRVYRTATDVTMSANRATLIDTAGTFGIRLSGSIQAVGVNFPVVGSYLVSTVIRPE